MARNIRFEESPTPIVKQGTFPALTIVSGGQTGVDRAALDFAMSNGIRCGGYCPAGRRAEDGVISSRYPLIETDAADYAVRTRKNVEISDGTLIVTHRPLVGGTALTKKFALELRKPLLIVPPRGLFCSELIEDWLKSHKIRVMNVAGPRESSVPGIYELTLTMLNHWHCRRLPG